jgi:hypothetical protein
MRRGTPAVKLAPEPLLRVRAKRCVARTVVQQIVVQHNADRVTAR